ncbi:hypothetical protein [Nannocystis sp. SCPEA4]|uniref:hypothetical protein n=1 Tax=Nannocystis sp. SCPEA4 TaxID=2996787 RepID=UPI00226F7DE3|nr:hypothetical protein [Nannocystis sp. SCPEA4]MCY1057117.1 hypothetical protein [Nannocystis sp. SCPEA4]
MRRSVLAVACVFALTPQLALANPYARASSLWAQAAATQPGTTTTTTTTVTTTTQPAADNPDWQPTSSKAPKSDEIVMPEKAEPAPEAKPEPTPEPTPPPPEPEKPKWTRHGFGIRGGISVIPTWAVRGYVQSMTNALCRGESIPGGKFGAGLTRVDGCNFYIGGEYIYRFSKNFDIVPAVAYHRLKAPDGLWLDDSEKDANGNPNLDAADYTQVNFSFVALQVDFIGRGTIVETPDFAFQLGGGGGLGIGIITGKGLWQTPLGNPALGSTDGNPQNTCNSTADYSDFTKCTPHWSPDPDNPGGAPPAQGSLLLDQSGPNVGRFAKCTKDSCAESDLNALGRAKGINLPVIPIVNLLVTARFLIKDTFGINLTGGWNTGFYFGGSLQYFFGSK